MLVINEEYWVGSALIPNLWISLEKEHWIEFKGEKLEWIKIK